MTLRKLAFIVAATLLAACSPDAPQTAAVHAQATDGYDPARDYFTYANTDAFVTRHLQLDLDVDFEAQALRGSATLNLQRTEAGATTVILDTRDLAIAGVVVMSGSGEYPAPFALGARDDALGAPLRIELPAATPDIFQLRIDYTTSPASTALQWLPARLTAGGEHPLMFSQSQAIHARSWVPLQDTPAVRMTYGATIRTPESLLAVMSANNDPKARRDGEYQFDMPQPIPSYLLAIAVGNLWFAPLGDETGVYAEPELLDDAVYEFADTQAMLEQAEQLFGPYQWGRYDLLVLPPSFPYGGMENPRLSFITPSLLAGDRSLVSVIAHELAHSWSGNLVTNATWRDGWLNEGVTNYLESRLMEVIYDRDRVDEERVLMYRELLLDFETVKPEMQALAPKLDGGDPEDFQGTIHYNKGQLFLVYLEQAFGREAFDRFLASYFDQFAFGTVTSEQFLDYLDNALLSAEGAPVRRAQVEAWLYGPGLPDDAPLPRSATLEAVESAAAAWSRGDIETHEIPVAAWSPQAVVHFINNLPADLPQAKLEEIDRAWTLSATRNAEIGRAWFIQVATRGHTPAYEALEAHLNRYGRGRLIAPVYAALANNGQDADLARQMFDKARVAYHPITDAWIEQALQPAAE
ncbi:MAG TPA: M1 family metallopeptidase [Woeseiaceae bacterium]